MVKCGTQPGNKIKFPSFGSALKCPSLSVHSAPASIIFLLVSMLLGVKAKLLPSGPVKILINDEKEIEVSSGSTLLSTLGDNKVFLPSACGGGGTCVQCKCIVNDGGGEILPTEKPHFSRKEIKEGWRLGCQVKVKENMNIHVPEEVFGLRNMKLKL